MTLQEIITEVNKNKDKISEKAKNLKAEIASDPVHAVEWNKPDELATLVLQINECDILISCFVRHRFELNKLLAILNDHITKLTDDLIGHSFLNRFEVTEGPWRRNSTSNGANRMAVIKSDVKRWQIGLLKWIVDELTNEEE